MTTQDQLFHTACQLVKRRYSNKPSLNSTTWTLLHELGSTPSLYLESSHINVCCLNTRSVKKNLSISDNVTSHDYDITCLTETWLRIDIDAVCISEMVPTGYEFYRVPRNTGRIGGGVGIMFKTGLPVTTVSSSNDTTVAHFEYTICRVEHHGATIHCIVVYHPPTSTQNAFKTSVFLQEWSSFIEHVAVEYADSIIVGISTFISTRTPTQTPIDSKSRSPPADSSNMSMNQLTKKVIRWMS